MSLEHAELMADRDLRQTERECKPEWAIEENRCPTCGCYMSYFEGWVTEGTHEAIYICNNRKCKSNA